MRKKYEIIKTEGCVSYGTLVNDQQLYGEYNPLSPVEIMELVDHLCERFKHELKRNNVRVDDLIDCFDYDDRETEDGYCETCGDSVTTTTWKL